MLRRDFLGAAAKIGIASGVAGCLGSDRSQDQDVESRLNRSDASLDKGSQIPRPDPTLSADEIDARFEEVSQVVDYETLPLTLSAHRVFGSVSAGIGITETATQESPAKIEISVVNRNDFEYVYKISEAPPYDTKPILYNQSHDPLYLVPTPSHPLVDYEDEPYTYAQEGTWHVSGGIIDWLPEVFRLESGRGFIGEYAVVGHHNRSGRPTGTYSTQGDGGTLSLALWETESPGPDRESVFENVEVPDLSQTPNRDKDDEDNEKTDTHWFHEADSETQIYLRPSMEKTDLPADIEFEFVNRSRKKVSGNPYGWDLYKLVDGDWFHIAPLIVNLPMSYVYPGDTERSSLHLFHGEGLGCECQTPDGKVRDVDRLGGGRYAYTVDFGREGERHAALLDIEAPELTIEKPDDVEVERRGSTVVVSTVDSEDGSDLSIRVERSDGTEGDRRVIAENIYRGNSHLRYSVPFFEGGVEAVVVETEKRAVFPSLPFSSETSKSYVYKGRTYTAEVLDDGST
ncbi:hypothetical protein ACEU6E_02475 [Halorutilales archaeon Cl-col2-1]